MLLTFELIRIKSERQEFDSDVKLIYRLTRKINTMIVSLLFISLSHIDSMLISLLLELTVH